MGSIISTIFLIFILPFLLIGLFIFLFIKVGKKMKEGKELREKITKGEIPESLKNKLKRKVQGYEPEKNILEIIRDLGYLRTSSIKYGSNTNKKETYFLYKVFTIKDLLKFRKDRLIKCHSINRILEFNISNVKNLMSITATKLKEGFLISIFADKKMFIIFNNQKVATLDYETHKVKNKQNKIIGDFTRPGFFEIIGVNGVNKEFKIKLNLNNKKIASIVPTPSTIDAIKQQMKGIFSGKEIDLHIFRNVNVRSFEEAIILLGVGLGEFGVLKKAELNCRSLQPKAL